MSHVLNYDVMSYVLRHLQTSSADLFSSLLVCRDWYDATQLDELWKSAFMARWPLIGRLTNPNNNSWRELFLTQMRRERSIASVLLNSYNSSDSSDPADIEYTGSAAGAPSAPLSDAFRLGCITENDESQKVFRDLSTRFPGLQIVTQTGKQESYSQKDGEWSSQRRAYLPAICWVAREGRTIDSEEGYWQIRRSLDLSGWVFKFIDRRRPTPGASEIDLAVYDLEKTIGPWVRNTQGGNSPSIRSVDFDDQSQNRSSFSVFSQWLYAIEQGLSVEHFSSLVDEEKVLVEAPKHEQPPVTTPRLGFAEAAPNPTIVAAEVF